MRAAAARVGALALTLTTLLSGCIFTETFHRGYVVPDGALEQIALGASQEQVLIVLGTPSTVATLSGEVFYYISQRTERTAFLPMKEVDRRVIAVYFDKSRRVQRKLDQRAEAGLPHGGSRRPFGYDDDKITLRPAEAQVIRDDPHRKGADELQNNGNLDIVDATREPHVQSCLRDTRDDAATASVFTINGDDSNHRLLVIQRRFLLRRPARSCVTRKTART